MADQITLPEITIVGDPNSPSLTFDDWWADGFIAGYNRPSDEPERPLMIDDELATIFFLGVQSGKEAAQEVSEAMEALIADQPHVEGFINGKSLEEAQKEYNEAFKVLFHEHMPHTEIEIELSNPPQLPNIGLVVD